MRFKGILLARAVVFIQTATGGQHWSPRFSLSLPLNSLLFDFSGGSCEALCSLIRSAGPCMLTLFPLHFIKWLESACVVITAWRRILFLPLSSPLFDSSRVDRVLSRATALIPLVYIVIFPVLLRWFLSCRSGSFLCYCGNQGSGTDTEMRVSTEN